MTERSQSYLLPTIAPMANIIAKPPTRKGSHIMIGRSLFRVTAENAGTKAAIADGFIVGSATLVRKAQA